MEAQKRKLRSRKLPLSNITNVDKTRFSSHSSSSSAIATASTVKSLNPQVSSARNIHLNRKFNAGETAGSISNRTASENPSFAPPPLDSTPSRSPPPNSTWVSGIRDGGVWEPLSVYSRRKISGKSKSKGNTVVEPMISTTATGDGSDDIEDIILDREMKSLPLKKQRVMLHDHISKNVLPRDYIEKQRAYFDEIDSEPLSVEEIASDEDLD